MPFQQTPHVGDKYKISHTVLEVTRCSERLGWVEVRSVDTGRTTWLPKGVPSYWRRLP